jgi:hypothetical protein
MEGIAGRVAVSIYAVDGRGRHLRFAYHEFKERIEVIAIVCIDAVDIVGQPSTARAGIGRTWRKASKPEIAFTASAAERGFENLRAFVTME